MPFVTENSHSLRSEKDHRAVLTTAAERKRNISTDRRKQHTNLFHM
jgi:hypothetical protein